MPYAFCELELFAWHASSVGGSAPVWGLVEELTNGAVGER